MPTPEDPTAVVRAAFAAMNDRDRQAFAELLAPDAVHHTPVGTFEGRETYVDQEFEVFDAYPDSVYEITHCFGDGALVALRAVWTGTRDVAWAGQDVTGREIETTMNEIYHVEDGQILEVWSETDMMTQARQLGVVEDLEVRNQYLQVLNRMLRHNLRNDVGTITAYAEAMADDEDDDRLATVTETADRLVGLAEKARALEETVVDRELDPGEVAVGPLLEHVAESAQPDDRPATVTVDVPDDCRLVTDPDLLETALVELVENGVVHGGDEPSVELAATQSVDDWAVELTVADDGPGIPDHEVAPLEQGSEDPLVHASGIGLWAAKWAVDRLEGDVAFADREPTGTVVSVRLPDLDSS